MPKKVENTVNLILLFISAAVLSFVVYDSLNVEEAQARRAPNRFLWVERIPISTISVDTTFDSVWEQVSLKTLTTTARLRLAADSDTSTFYQRQVFNMSAGESVSIGGATKLRRVQAVTTSNDTLVLIGYKRTRQTF